MPPELFTPLKIIHVLSAIVAIGTNVTYAFWLRRAGLDRERLVFAITGISAIDRRLANPGYVLLLVTGILMVLTGMFRFEQGWLAVSIILYVLVAGIGGAVYAPTIRRQLAEAQRDPTSAAYAAVARRSAQLGVLTLAIVVVIVVLMVSKPF